VVPHLFLKQLKLFIVNERMKIGYYLQSISHVHQDCKNSNEFLERRKRWFEIKIPEERVLKELSEHTLNPFSPLGVLGFKVRD
jgi:hypothetical protein